MNSKNTIIRNYASSLMAASSEVFNATTILGDNADENNATVKTLYILVDSLKAQTILLQSVLDEYNK